MNKNQLKRIKAFENVQVFFEEHLAQFSVKRRGLIVRLDSFNLKMDELNTWLPATKKDIRMYTRKAAKDKKILIEQIETVANMGYLYFYSVNNAVLRNQCKYKKTDFNTMKKSEFYTHCILLINTIEPYANELVTYGLGDGMLSEVKSLLETYQTSWIEADMNEKEKEWAIDYVERRMNRLDKIIIYLDELMEKMEETDADIYEWYRVCRDL